jgi:hypothetical protein
MGQLLRPLVRDVDALLTHHLDNRGVEVLSRRRTGRVHLDTLSAYLAGERRGHLGSAGVVHAEEEDFGLLGTHGAPY